MLDFKNRILQLLSQNLVILRIAFYWQELYCNWISALRLRLKILHHNCLLEDIENYQIAIVKPNDAAAPSFVHRKAGRSCVFLEHIFVRLLHLFLLGTTKIVCHQVVGVSILQK